MRMPIAGGGGQDGSCQAGPGRDGSGWIGIDGVGAVGQKWRQWDRDILI